MKNHDDKSKTQSAQQQSGKSADSRDPWNEDLSESSRHADLSRDSHVAKGLDPSGDSRDADLSGNSRVVKDWDLSDFKRLHGLQMSKADQRDIWNNIQQQHLSLDAEANMYAGAQADKVHGFGGGSTLGGDSTQAGAHSQGSGISRLVPQVWRGRRRWMSGLAAVAAIVIVAGGMYVAFGPNALQRQQGQGNTFGMNGNTATQRGGQGTAQAGTDPAQWQPMGPSYLVQGTIASLDKVTTFNSNNQPVQQLQSIKFQMQQVLANPNDGSGLNAISLPPGSTVTTPLVTPTSGSNSTGASQEGQSSAGQGSSSNQQQGTTSPSGPNEPFPAGSTQTIRVDEPWSHEGNLNLQPYDTVEMVVTEYTSAQGKLFWGANFTSIYVERQQTYYDRSGRPFVAASQYWQPNNPFVRSLTIKAISKHTIVGKVPDYQTQGMKDVKVELTANTKVWNNGSLVSLSQAPSLKAGQSIEVVSKGSAQGNTIVPVAIYGPTTQVLGRVEKVSGNTLTLQALTATTQGQYHTSPNGKTLRVEYNSRTLFDDGSTTVHVVKGDVLRCQVSGFLPGLLLAQGIAVEQTRQLNQPYVLGKIRLGESFGQVAQELGQPSSKGTAHGEGGPEWNYQGKGIQVDGDPVWNIIVKAPFAGATLRGIHIGSTEAAVKKAYPTAEVYHNGGETTYAVFSPNRKTELLMQCKSGKVYLITLQGRPS